jgi:hypothetical protein
LSVADIAGRDAEAPPDAAGAAASQIRNASQTHRRLSEANRRCDRDYLLKAVIYKKLPASPRGTFSGWLATYHMGKRKETASRAYTTFCFVAKIPITRRDTPLKRQYLLSVSQATLWDRVNPESID